MSFVCKRLVGDCLVTFWKSGKYNEHGKHQVAVHLATVGHVQRKKGTRHELQIYTREQLPMNATPTTQ